MLRSALDGYNGTVFAFGQTGSGKTFTITGGAERYADRGLIPRAISALFAETAARGAGGSRTSAAGAGAGGPSPPSPASYSVHVSYMEIYNEAGFDLLEPGREVRALEDLPRVRAAVFGVGGVFRGEKRLVTEPAAVLSRQCQACQGGGDGDPWPSTSGCIALVLHVCCTCAAFCTVLPCPTGPHPRGRRLPCALPQPVHAPLRHRGAGAQHGGWATGWLGGGK